MPTSAEIRQQFIDYFRQKHSHRFVPSSPVVPHDDPTLLFTNAGMNQFKDIFLGVEQDSGRDYARAVNSQKCIRAGGKHNDLEDVGKDTYHHTFFEMLGNWSFGDYFKKEAITWAWDLLTNVWGLDKSRLHATVFEGDSQLGLDADDEALKLWKEVTDIDPAHIHYGDKKDNFWEMGDTGPCGPCSEIHIDLSPNNDRGHLVNQDDPQVIEIWNLVFIQFNRNSAGLLTPLPQQHVDTGMGFERITAVLQGKKSNYDTDVFTPLFEAIAKLSGARPYGGKLDDPIDTAYRVIADHIRCLSFALTDGAVPSNEGRGYVLRRILRRAFRHGRQTLGQKQPFLHNLVPTVVEHMGEAFPELRKNPQHVAEIIREEEESFNRTIDRGIALFEEAAGRGGDRISGDDAFMLYDTYGFPLDLTQVMAEERGMSVDLEGFNRLMQQQREQSRAGAGSVDARQSLTEIVQRGGLPSTEFLGYNHTTEAEVDGPVQLFAHRQESGYEPLDHLSPNMHGAVVLGRTPFYAEAGGQVGDTGVIEIGEARFRVEDTIRVGESTFHLGQVESGTLKEGEHTGVRLHVDRQRRAKIAANHTSTHLLNFALRRHVDESVDQRGSLVDDARTRFDFSCNHALGEQTIAEVERTTNELIAADLPVQADEAPQEEARRIAGLRAVFGEKYPPRVRVVSIGPAVAEILADPQNEKWRDYSIEFCGGTHLDRTGEAEGFTIISEEAVAKGVRRVSCLTGQLAHEASAEAEALLNRMEAVKQADESDERGLRDEVAALTQAINEKTLPLVMRAKLKAGLAELQQIVKRIEKERSQQAAQTVIEQARQLAEAAEGDVIVSALEGADNNALRQALDVLRRKRPDAAVLLLGSDGQKVAIVAAVPDAKQQQGLKAGDWVKEVAPVVGGGGGGKPDMAQAGGKDPTKISEAVEKAKGFAMQRA